MIDDSELGPLGKLLSEHINEILKDIEYLKSLYRDPNPRIRYLENEIHKLKFKVEFLEGMRND